MAANWKKTWVAPRQSKQGGSPATTLHKSHNRVDRHVICAPFNVNKSYIYCKYLNTANKERYIRHRTCMILVRVEHEIQHQMGDKRTN
jgi:hypothetical protein